METSPLTLEQDSDGADAARAATPLADALRGRGKRQRRDGGGGGAGAGGARAAAAADGGGGGLCVPVLVRLSVIDYLREWRLTEQMEHLHKSLTRDLLAGERNHAVVPVDQFAARFEQYFGARLATPVPPPQMWLVAAAADALAALAAHLDPRARDWLTGRRHDDDDDADADAEASGRDGGLGWVGAGLGHGLRRAVSGLASVRSKATSAHAPGPSARARGRGGVGGAQEE